MSKLGGYLWFVRRYGLGTLLRYERARRAGMTIDYSKAFTPRELWELEDAGLARWKTCAECGHGALGWNRLKDWGHEPGCMIFAPSGHCTCGKPGYLAHEFRCPVPVEGDVAPHAPVIPGGDDRSPFPEAPEPEGW